MRPYGPAPPTSSARGGVWVVAIVAVFLGPHLAPALADGFALPDLPTAARSSPSPHDGGGGRAARAVRYALAQQGKPYRWGAEGPQSFDCSGLTWAAWRRAGRTIPRTAAGQLAGLPHVRGKLRPGDLVIYATNGPSRRHVAMVINRHQMIEARGRGILIRTTALRGGWLGAVRP